MRNRAQSRPGAQTLPWRASMARAALLEKAKIRGRGPELNAEESV